MTNEFRINNFVNKFSFYEENNIIGKKVILKTLFISIQ